jgi:hypothetical protein
VFEQLAATQPHDLSAALAAFGLTDAGHARQIGGLRRTAEGRAVPLPGTHRPNDEIITLLAAGFARGEPGSPAIPYARLED